VVRIFVQNYKSESLSKTRQLTHIILAFSWDLIIADFHGFINLFFILSFEPIKVTEHSLTVRLFIVDELVILSVEGVLAWLQRWVRLVTVVEVI
jgi:hypothetical protein